MCALEQGLALDEGGCDFDDIDIDIPGFVVDDPNYATGDNFEYSCDTGGCRYPYAERINSDFHYWIFFRDVIETDGQLNTCRGDNEKGRRICKSLGGKEIQGRENVYEL